MDINQYIIQFQQAADQLNKGTLDERQIEIAVGTLSESIFLKLFKKSWSNPGQDPLTAESRIFFSIWVTEQGIKQQKLFFNIHAFKLRKLQG